MAEMKVYSQNDPAWKSKLLGFDKKNTIGGYGCLMTSMTMVASVYGFGDNPDTVNDKMKAISAFQAAYIIPGSFPSVANGTRYVNYLVCTNAPAPMAEIDNYLVQGKPVIVQVDYNPSTPTIEGHWIVLTAKQGEDYLIQDPWPFPVRQGETLMAKYGKGKKGAGEVVQEVLFFDGVGGVPAKPPKLDTGVAATFPVYAMCDDLAIRSQTFVSDATLLKRVPINTQFKVLEKDDAATAKIGVQNQWLAVKAADGTEGYAAAWYVAKTKQSATAPTAPAPAATTGKMVVKTSTDGVKLRKTPEINDTNIVKAMPLNSELEVLDAPADAQAKIGVVYQWLKVRDVAKAEGFVAAWYVVPVSGFALGVGDQRQTVPPNFSVGGEVPPLFIRAKQDGLALRSEPIIHKDTLIKRLPLDADLVAIEPPDVAVDKLGKMGEWIHAEDITGDRGYVAAWYVEERPEDANPVTGPDDC